MLLFDTFLVMGENDRYITTMCTKCQAVRYYDKKYKNKMKHGLECSKYYKNHIIRYYGARVYEVFSSKYRGAKNRCTNPNNKDYTHYGQYEWGFEDFTDFMHSLLPDFLNAVNLYGVDNLSIDRIDGNFGYIKGNIRFIPMGFNLRNKDCIKEVICENLITGDVLIYENCRVCAASIGVSPTRIWECCNRDNHEYRQMYKFSYA